MKDETKQLIIDTLDQMFPDATIELNYQNQFELLIAVLLSAQTTDKRVNLVTKELFLRYKEPIDYLNANIVDIENIIKSIGLYRSKAKHIKDLSTMLVNDFNGNVPNNKTDLMKLPGVGPKTANVVLSVYFNKSAFAIDTHVSRVSKRLGFAKKNASLAEIEKNLERAIPKSKWKKMHHQLIFFGRYHCKARNPQCKICPLYDICKYKAKNR